MTSVCIAPDQTFSVARRRNLVAGPTRSRTEANSQAPASEANPAAIGSASCGSVRIGEGWRARKEANRPASEPKPGAGDRASHFRAGGRCGGRRPKLRWAIQSALPSRTALRASRSWSPSWGPPPTKRQATFAVLVDDDGLGIALASVLLTTAAVAVKRDCRVHLMPLRHHDHFGSSWRTGSGLRPGPWGSSATASLQGIAWRHGPHQDAQKSRRTTLPRTSAVERLAAEQFEREKWRRGLPTSEDWRPEEGRPDSRPSARASWSRQGP